MQKTQEKIELDLEIAKYTDPDNPDINVIRGLGAMEFLPIYQKAIAVIQAKYPNGMNELLVGKYRS